MSRTLYGHHIETIKGEDYVLHKDYTELQNKYYKQKEVLDKIKEYIKETKESDSYTTLPSGKITDIEYCLVALEDIEDLLNGKELKGEEWYE